MIPGGYLEYALTGTLYLNIRNVDAFLKGELFLSCNQHMLIFWNHGSKNYFPIVLNSHLDVWMLHRALCIMVYY